MSRHRSILIALTTAGGLLACLLVLFAPTLAHAFTEDTSYPATSCRKLQGNLGILGTRLDGGIENDSPGEPLVVICPIVRDNTQTTGAWTIEASVRDQSGTAAVSCTASSVSTFGAAIAANSKSTSVGPVGRATLTMTPGSQGVEGYSVLKCTIPASSAGLRSGLRAYVVREPGGIVSETDTKTYSGTYAELATASAGTFPFINYPDLGKAKPIAAAADDTWILPLVRDRETKEWDRARFRFNDSDGDQVVECWMANFNEDGSIAGFLSYASQQGLAPGQATNQIDLDPNAELNDGPLVMYCESIATDVTATMYDNRETDDP